MDHITNDTSLIGPCDVIPVGAQNPRFPVVGHRGHWPGRHPETSRPQGPPIFNFCINFGTFLAEVNN